MWCPSPRTRQSDKVSNYCGTIVLASSETDRRPGRLALYWNVDNAVGTDLFDRVWHDRYPEPCRHEMHDRRNLRASCPRIGLNPARWQLAMMLSWRPGPIARGKSINVSCAKVASDTERSRACGCSDGSTIRIGSRTSG